MTAPKPALALAVLAGAVVVAIVVAVRLRAEHQEVLQAVDEIEARFAGLDPVERAAVLARLSVHAVRDMKEMRT